MIAEGLCAAWCRHDLLFREPAVTSRAVMHTKETWFVKLWHRDNPEHFGIGECGLFRGLSADDRTDYGEILARVCTSVSNGEHMPVFSGLPSMKFGFETALLDLAGGGRRILYDTPWSRGESAITINGLVWMGSEEEMTRRMALKLEAGFRCIKIKIGGIDFDRELALLRTLRAAFSPADVELRLDANGAFRPEETLERLDLLATLGIHSIEQPIRAGQYGEMQRICRLSPIPVALDEELIGIEGIGNKKSLLEQLQPAYIILKPSLCGGIEGSKEWITAAKRAGAGWWLTSALESNIGLNAIAQFAAHLGVTMPQGLGTGALYTNNIPSPLVQERDILRTDPARGWDLSMLQWNIPS